MVRQRPSREHPQRPAAHHDDVGPDAVPDRALHLQVCPAWQERHVGERAPAAHGEDGRRDVLHPLDAHRSDQPRAGDLLHADRQPDRGPALPRVVDELRPGFAQQRLAHVRRARGPLIEARAAAGDRRPALVERLPARRVRGRELPQRRRSDPLHQQSARRARRRAPQDARRPPSPEPAHARPDRRSRNPHADRAIRDGLPDAVERARSHEHRERVGECARPLWRPGEGSWVVRQLLTHGPAHGGARRAVRAALPQPLGYPRQRRWPAQERLQRHRSALRRAHPRPEGPRPLGRDAHHLGRRVWPHDLLAGGPVEGELRPRPSSAVLHDVDGRRRRPRRPGLRRDR